jgi:hypothetical protein
MAIQKTLQTSFGVEANYWKILRTNEAFPGSTEVFLAGYANEQARRDGKQPFEIKTFLVDTIDGKRKDYYVVLTASKKEIREITPAIPAVEEVKDEEGNVIVEAVAEIPAVTEEVETNEFAGTEEV